MLRWRFLLMLVAMAGATDASAQSAWQVVRVPGTAITFEMPGTPSYKAIDSKSPAGTPYKVHQYAVGDSNRGLMFDTGLHPRDVDMSEPRRNLQAGIDGQVAGIKGGKWEKIVWMQYQGAPAAEVYGPFVDRGAMRYRIILKGQQLYGLAIGGLPELLYTAEVERFFNSLRLQ